MYTLSKNSLKRREGINPKLIAICDLALTISTIDFGIPAYGGLRTPQQQYKLFEDGKSKCDGFNKLSEHQSGNAIDVYAYINGGASWDKLHLSLVACAFLQAASVLGHQLEWGGNWRSFQDMPHFQLIGD